MAFNKNYAIVGLGFYFIILMVSELITKWNDIPDIIPSHYNSKGEVDRQSSKNILLIIPTIGFVVLILLVISAQNPPQWIIPIEINDENRKEVIQSTKTYFYFITVILNSYLRVVNASLIRSKHIGMQPLITFISSLVIITMFYHGNISKVSKDIAKSNRRKARVEQMEKMEKVEKKKNNKNKKKKRN